MTGCDIDICDSETWQHVYKGVCVACNLMVLMSQTFVWMFTAYVRNLVHGLFLGDTFCWCMRFQASDMHGLHMYDKFFNLISVFCNVNVIA